MEAENAGLFDDALDRLDKAKQLLSQRHDGREVVAFFQGEANYYAAQAPGLQPAKVTQLLNEAEAFFKEALAQNPGFVRAQIGLGSVSFDRAHAQGPDGVLDQAQLDRAIAAYEEAERLTPASPERAWVENVATLALGTAYYVKGGALFEAGEDTAAQPRLERAADLLDKARPALEAANDHRLLALTLLNRGNALFPLGQISFDQRDYARSKLLYESSGAMYDACAAQATTVRDDELLAQFADECQEGRRDVDEALTHFEGVQP